MSLLKSLFKKDANRRGLPTTAHNFLKKPAFSTFTLTPSIWVEMGELAMTLKPAERFDFYIAVHERIFAAHAAEGAREIPLVALDRARRHSRSCKQLTEIDIQRIGQLDAQVKRYAEQMAERRQPATAPALTGA